MCPFDQLERPMKGVLCIVINPDSAGGSTCHLSTLDISPGTEHVNRTASPGHAALLLDTREASVEVNGMEI